MEKKPVTQTLKKRAGQSGQSNGEPAVFCACQELVAASSLKPHPKNANTHPPEQLRVYAKVIRANGWRRPVVVSSRSGFIVKGHGAWLTAQAEGWRVPVERQDYASPADEIRDLVADNELAKAAETDQAKLEELLAGMTDIELAGVLAELPAAPDLAALVSPEPPPSVKENLEHMESIKAQRKRGNQNIIAKTDTEHYLIVVYKDRTAREAALKLLGLPPDERYLPADAVKISRRRRIPSFSANGAAAAPPNKAGACG